MKSTQDPKYSINDAGQICNTATGKPIPKDEPIFILRAQDMTAEQTISYYLTMVATEEHKQSILRRIFDFKKFRHDNPTKMKAPDTAFHFPGM